jgi:hypothetical protein
MRKGIHLRWWLDTMELQKPLQVLRAMAKRSSSEAFPEKLLKFMGKSKQAKLEQETSSISHHRIFLSRNIFLLVSDIPFFLILW